ncbi:dynactin p62 family-domain-containing protein [Phellopilus nigrolimitatus]|nr:dynactin p62 family-domain-containing protein [Phellopilus nigrolimitatus]
MVASINYYCSCMSATPVPPPPHLPSSSASYHPLHTLFFCEECDAVRCNRCVSIEVSGYYCPNCLFEVPSASVRAERNRCARNCFQCPHCRNTLSVVPSDPEEDGMSHSPSAGAMGEPPFLLYCNNCRWDSAEVGITFEKPTGLAQQLQRSEDSAPEFLEFERLKDFFEPLLRSSLSSSQSGTPSGGVTGHNTHMNAITAAASSALARDIPGVGKYITPPARGSSSRAGRAARHGSKDDMPIFRARVEISGSSGLGAGGDGDAEMMRHLELPAEVSRLEQRWTSSWAESPQARELRPIRIPLHSRLTKRCPACRHILIKPEQKAQSVRYKIKLVAANYLPAINVDLPSSQPTSATRRVSIAQRDDDGGVGKAPMMAGKTYPFQLSMTNPLYDPIQVRLAVQRQQLPAVSESADESGGTVDKPRRPPFGVTLPSSSFSVAAFAEAWEYEDDEEMFGVDDEDALATVGASPTKDRAVRGKAKTVGVLEKKANMTVVGGEVLIGREGRGDVKFNMLVSYTYRSDEPQDDGEGEVKTRSATKTVPETKTFSFYTVVNLGTIVPREDPMDL